MSITGKLEIVWHCQECGAVNELVHPVRHEIDRIDLIACVACQRVNAVTTTLSISIDTETTTRKQEQQTVKVREVLLPYYPDLGTTLG